MKIAHTCSNSNSGMANVARDEVMAERKLGVDARMVFPEKHRFSPAFTGQGSEGIKVGDIAWARKADVLVIHSGLRAGEEKWLKPRIAVAHGNPYHCFILERVGSLNSYTTTANFGRMPYCHKVVTYWELDVPYWEAIMPAEKVAYVPASVNLDEWQPGPPDADTFEPLSGDINIVSTSRMRATLDPFPVWNAFRLFAKRFPDKKVKLHIYGSDADFTGTPPLFGPLYREGRLGHLMPSAPSSALKRIYHTADMCITAHRTESLTVRESMACGCPVVGDITLKATPYTAPVHDARAYAEVMYRAYMDGQRLGRDGISAATRADAEKHFQPEPTARAFIKLCEEAMAADRPECKMRVAKEGEEVTGIMWETGMSAGDADPAAYDYPGKPIDGEGMDL